MLPLSHISQPGVIPDSRRRALCGVKPRFAAINAQAHHVDIRRYRHLELRAHVVGLVVIGDTTVVNQFNIVDADLGIDSDLQRCRMAGVPRFIFD
nr:hypothetical protein [Salmonella enterica]